MLHINTLHSDQLNTLHRINLTRYTGSTYCDCHMLQCVKVTRNIGHAHWRRRRGNSPDMCSNATAMDAHCIRRLSVVA